jgi:hypothetical protein
MLDRLIETLEKHAQRSLDSSVQSQIADKLGWVLVTGTDAAKAKPVLTLVHDADKSGAEVLDDSGKYEQEKKTIEKSLKAFEMFPGASLILNAMQVVCGRMDEHDVYLFPGSEGGSENSSSRRKLDLIVLLNNRLNLKLHMYPEHWYSKVGKFLFRLQDIHIGDERVDEAFMIKSSESRTTMHLLRKPEILESLHVLIDEPFEAPVVNDVAVRNTVYYPVQAEQVIDHLQKLVRLAAALSNHKT